MGAYEFCASCGKAFSTTERFCTNCGANRPVQVQPPVIPTAIATQLPDPNQPNLTFQTPPKIKRNFINKKIAAIVLLPILLLTLGGAGYWFINVRVDYAAKTIAGVLLNSSSRTDKLISNSCSSLESEVDLVYTNHTTLAASIYLDYSQALSLESNHSSEFVNTLNTWAGNILKANLGDRASKLQFVQLVKRDLVQQVTRACDLTSRVSEAESKARGLDEEIRNINSPGSWEPDDYWQSNQDPNIAWKWAPNYSFSCSSYSDGCNRVFIVTKRDCPGSVNVKFGLLYTRDGSTQENEYGSINDVLKGRVYGLTVTHYGYEYDWWRVESVTCRA